MTFSSHKLQTFICMMLLVLTTVVHAQTEVLNPVTPYWKVTGNAGTNSGTHFIGTTNNVSLRFRTNNNERMVIDSTGFLGIGKASPTQRLDVLGNFRLSGAFMPNNNAGLANQLLLSGGPNNPALWSPFIFGNTGATTQLAKYYAALTWNGNWTNGSLRYFVINDPDCTTSSSIHVSFTGDAAGLLDGIEINNVQTGNGYFVVTAFNRTGAGLTGGIAISFIAFY